MANSIKIEQVDMDKAYGGGIEWDTLTIAPCGSMIGHALNFGMEDCYGNEKGSVTISPDHAHEVYEQLGRLLQDPWFGVSESE